MSAIRTFTGIMIDPTEPDSELIDIRDIAHALSLLCRANGHFSHFYSVAQHSLACMREAKARGYGRRTQLACLLHDASEAYLSDVTRPIKGLMPEYLVFEKRLQDMIYEKYIGTLSESELSEVSEADDCMLYYEFLALTGLNRAPNSGLLSSARRNPTFCGNLRSLSETPQKYKKSYGFCINALKSEKTLKLSHRTVILISYI